MDTNDILSTTTNTIYRFIQQKNGGDCLLLYFRYLIQSRLQGTSNTHSNDKFMMKAMGWGKERFGKAKTYLVTSGTIEPIVRRDDKGVIISHYVRVKFDVALLDPQPSNPTDWENPPSGFQEPNTIVENINTIVENIDTQDITNIVKTRNPRNNQIDVVISSFKESLQSRGYSYVNIKERIFAYHLSKNVEWKRVVEESGGDSGSIIQKVMGWTYQDAFWNGKICSLQAFYYKWGMLVNKMKQEGKWTHLNAKDDDKRKMDALEYFNSIK